MPQRHRKRDALSLEFGKLTRAARKKAGLTQREVAERVGVVTEVYGRMERGTMLPSMPTLLRLCLALRVDANALLGFSFTKAPVWLARPPAIDSEPPAVRRLLGTARQLGPKQLRALNTVANAMLPSQDARDT